ncbi:MAG: ribosomal RNA small subunit methyltransferase A [Chloroflexi bacterium]|nr:ribosomal RNA small subunit methyltransferase A [Chloroflexota bacterium]
MPSQGSDFAHPSVRALLDSHGLRPRKSLGQNFLVDPVALSRIVAAAELSPDDIVLEIGPGPGGLTERLLEQAGRVVAVELDANMVALLREQLGNDPRLRIVEGDILKQDPGALLALRVPADNSPHPNYKVVANLPYYITSAVIRHLTEAALRPACAVFTVQREVAARIVAKPGQMSLLAVSVQLYGEPRIVARVPAGAFYPRPKVDSAVVRIRFYPALPLSGDELARFFRVVRAGFGQRRKQIHNALAAGLALPDAVVREALEQGGIDARRRAETLEIDEWVRLCRALAA